MKKIKVIAFILAVLMLQPLVLSCSSNSKTGAVVKADDPWFESVRFKFENEQLATEMLDSSAVSYANGKIYHMYSLTNLADFDNCRRTILDTYDEGGRLLNRTKLKDPGNYSIDRVISIRPDSEGKEAEVLALLFAPGSFETGIITVDLSSGEAKDPKLLKKKDGSTLEIQGEGMVSSGVSDVYTAGEYIIPVIYSDVSSGNHAAHAFSFIGSECKSELDFSGLPTVYSLEEFSFDSRSNTVFTVGYTMTDGPMVLEFDPETGSLISSEKYSAQGGDEVNLADYKPVMSGDLCKIDSLGNITTFDMQSREVKTVIDNNWYTPYFSDLSCDEVKLVSCDSNMAVIYSGKMTEYSVLFMGKDETVTILKKADKNPHAGKKVIEITTPIDKDITEYLSNAIYEFNSTDNEYLISVWSKYKSGIKAGRDLSILNIDDEKVYTMIQELNGSEAPDIAIGIQKNYAMRDEVFQDLTGYLDQSVMDMQFVNIIEASKIGGKQYFLPVTLEIEGLVTDTSLIKDGACGITFEDYEKMIENDLDGFSPYDYPLSTYNYKKDFLLSCIDTKSAIEGDNVDFGTEQFYSTVENSDKLFTEDGFTKSDDYVWDDEAKRTRSACRYDKIESFLDFVHACKDDSGSYTIIGTPSVNGTGPRFRAIETISVTASSDRKDGAKKFINFLFAGAGYSDLSGEFRNLVTNRDIMARNIELISEQNNQGRDVDMEMNDLMTGLGDYAAAYGYKYATDDMSEKMMDSLSSISTYYYDDPVITAFLVEEIAPYYAGDRSLDEAVRILNDRCNKYIKEM